MANPVREICARSRAKIWTTMGSASHSLARDGVYVETPEKWPALALTVQYVFGSLVALPAANCQTHQRLRRVSGGLRPRHRWGGLLPASCAADQGIVSQKCRLSSSGLRPLSCAPRLTHGRSATIQFAQF